MQRREMIRQQTDYEEREQEHAARVLRILSSLREPATSSGSALGRTSSAASIASAASSSTTAQGLELAGNRHRSRSGDVNNLLTVPMPGAENLEATNARVSEQRCESVLSPPSAVIRDK
ncbi:hypothetical protein TraAM80_09404 [Trypanosoma rangeli]|uniref:Uncharacterized protein n=1 Tax=Trypanosoma rangeli TaxID=5698 RepID=A0A3R7JV60_TRYRA|nr:uncharacterized protein TraAM80_09404 [Trypanosoma rangeli]RNE97325.1 hypothetical protein TraAM80_09404 [Trypanosoma rangeli]|eukprot:RNE97325.1 hypothetical protein TraAM80_09404 [Trypanosoma rangeli]